MGLSLDWLIEEIDTWPEPIRDAVSVLFTGQSWPEGDEDKVWELAEAWTQFGEQIARIHEEANSGAEQVMRSWAGDGTPEAFQRTWSALADGPQSPIGSLYDSVQLMYDTTFQTGLQIAQSKYEIVIEIILLLVELIVYAVLIPFTGGGSTAAMAASVALRRLAINRIMATLRSKVAALGLRRIGATAARRGAAGGVRAGGRQAAGGLRNNALYRLGVEGVQEGVEERIEAPDRDVSPGEEDEG